jgi:hypothetical protein
MTAPGEKEKVTKTKGAIAIKATGFPVLSRSGLISPDDI